MGFSQLLDRFFCLHQILDRKWSTIKQYIDFKKAYDWVRREVLYSILIKFGVVLKLVTLIEMCVNQTYK
jgi:hypothetical protein